PAVYHVAGANGGDLRVGKLVARVETKAAQGFAIQVPGATIVDLGTEFGTAVDAKEGSYVEVSAGKVDVIVRQGERRQLGAGQSLRLTTSGQIDIESSDNKQPPTFAWSLPEKRPPRLLLHWTFDELREDGTAPDASGNGLHGRLEGSMGQANLVEGPTGFGQALALDGRRQRVVLAGPRERALNHTFRELTIAAWIRPQAESAGYFLGKMGGGGERGWQFMVGNRSISLLFFPTAADDGRTVVTAPLDSAVTEQFTHVAATLSADGAVRLYLNGRLVEQAQSPGGMNWRNSANFSVGHRGDSLPKEYFAGAVDDVRIYDRALTNSEILDLLNISSPQEDG
ncbi:MAG: LamG-like jellyroll fold domain-containing protein, partial [Pirellulales bacterium]